MFGDLFFFITSLALIFEGGSGGQLLELKLPNVRILRDEGLQLINSSFVMIRS